MVSVNLRYHDPMPEWIRRSFETDPRIDVSQNFEGRDWYAIIKRNPTSVTSVAQPTLTCTACGSIGGSDWTDFLFHQRAHCRGRFKCLACPAKFNDGAALRQHSRDKQHQIAWWHASIVEEMPWLRRNDGENNEYGLVETTLGSSNQRFRILEPLPSYGRAVENADGTMSEASTERNAAGTAAAMVSSPYGAAVTPRPQLDHWRMGRIHVRSATPPENHPLAEENRRLRARLLQLTRFLADRQREIPGASDVLHSAW